MVPFPFMSQRYYQFSRFILQYNKMHHDAPFDATWNQSVNMAEVDIKPKWVKLTLEKNDISEKFRRFFKKFRLNSKEI